MSFGLYSQKDNATLVQAKYSHKDNPCLEVLSK